MAYMDNPQTFTKRARRVIPGYADLVSDYLGMAQIILAFLCFILSIIGFLVKSYPSGPASGMLLAIPLFVCGLFGVLAGVRKETWAVICYLVCSIVSLFLCLVLLGSAIVGIASEYQRDSSVAVAVREGIDIALMTLCLLCGASTVTSIVITGIHVVSHCKCVKGAKYVQEPNVQFSNPTTPSDMENRTGENAGYDQHSNGVTIATIPTHDTDSVATIATISKSSTGAKAAVELHKGQPHFNNPLANTSIS